jgi:hypothetical protein
MCGFAGFVGSAREQELRAQVCRMAKQLVHRGPDDSGYWVDAEAGLASGFRRLAIVDLPPAGHQHMSSANAPYLIVFNGEVYNLGELRKGPGLLGHGFRGHSDTEVMLEAVSEWGVEAAELSGTAPYWSAKEVNERGLAELLRLAVKLRPLPTFPLEAETRRVSVARRKARDALLNGKVAPAPRAMEKTRKNLLLVSSLDFKLERSRAFRTRQQLGQAGFHDRATSM